ncbi:hypothetical protein K469DRAFT_685783 [Zopfia rhizophila CBS 207.26]|uniref:Uncharacterized protein n=1 Tax=Zopfia rhizophila CBS 207.26 TaxID=1314779 RepID=A0A6A6E9K2_9PEZI|nr:hypothetical protein K469DRAFT_685783 [Zopfia rhizophila CBS 207.26]
MAPDRPNRLAQHNFSNLHEFVLGNDILITHCPLDYGRHSLSPTTDLGSLDKLVTELQFMILRNLDVQSTRFPPLQSAGNATRRWSTRVQNCPSQCAKYASYGDWNRYAHIFTIVELFEKLGQHCDFCGKLAPFLDVFTC